MANYTETANKGEQQADDNGKFILDCTAYPSFTNTHTPRDKQLTEDVRVNSVNGQFRPTHKTSIKISTGNHVAEVSALRYDGLKNQLLATHDLIDNGTPIVLMKDAARVMNSNETNEWICKESTKLEDKVNNIYIVRKNRKPSPLSEHCGRKQQNRKTEYANRPSQRKYFQTTGKTEETRLRTSATTTNADSRDTTDNTRANADRGRTTGSRRRTQRSNQTAKASLQMALNNESRVPKGAY